MIDRTDIQRIATATVGAFVLSATFILGAVGPARAAEPQVRTTISACPAATILLAR
jgi:hypothetical protein